MIQGVLGRQLIIRKRILDFFLLGRRVNDII